MDVIRNYLESMFANLPNTPEVQKAKAELLQMMEDKYTSLLEEGKKENEAVGIVISEFGNLDEIAETLGISGVMKNADHDERRGISREVASQYVLDSNKSAFLTGLGVLFCIIAPAFPALFEGVNERIPGDAIGPALFFVSIAVAVGLFIYAGSIMKQWKFIKDTPCCIDYQTAEELGKAQKMNHSGKTLCLIMGVLLCIFSIIPTIIGDELPSNFFFSDNLAPALMFVMVGIGVALIIFSNGKDKAYRCLLSLNKADTVSGNYNAVNSAQKNNGIPTAVLVLIIIFGAIFFLGRLAWSFSIFPFSVISGRYSAGNRISFDESYKEVTSLYLDADMMEVNLDTGDGDEVLVAFEGNEKLKPIITLDNGKLSISQQQNVRLSPRDIGKNINHSSLSIVLPENVSLSILEADIDMGNMALEGISADNMSIDVDMGNVEGDDIKTQKADINCNMGNVAMDSVDFTELFIETDMGNVEISSEKDLSDYAFSCNADLGSVQINGANVSKDYKSEGSAGKVSVETDMGNVSIDY